MIGNAAMALLALLKTPVAWAIGAGLAIGFSMVVIYDRGEAAGNSGAAAAVEHTAILEQEKARKDKDIADDKIRTAAPDTVIDSTR